jgi:hopanoid biosynthesis associated RND transporter like protein HpnN
MRKLGERILVSTAAACVRRPWLILAVSAVLTLLAGWYSTTLGINTSTDDILSHSLPFKKIESAYRRDFPKQEAALIIVDGPTGADADSAADNLAVRLRDKTDLFKDVEVPGQSEFFTDNGLLYLDRDKLDSFLNDLEGDKALLTQFARDPSLRGVANLAAGRAAAPGDEAQTVRLFNQIGETAAAHAEGDEDKRIDWVSVLDLQRPGSRPGTRRFVLAKPILDNASLDRAGPALKALSEEIEGVRSEEAEGVKIAVTGDPTLRQQELNDAFSGAVAASGLSFILVALSLILGIRSGRLILTLLIVLIVGGVWTTGLATLFVGRLNLISVAFMVLFVGLGVDFGTHLGLRFLEERKKGVPFEKALSAAMIEEAPSIGLSTLCAIVAFLSFVPTSYTGLAEFGIISALGMVVAFVVTFTVQPALMAIMPPKVPSWGHFDIGIGGFIKRHHMAILVVSGLVTIGALYAASSARIDVNPLNLQDPKAAPVVAYRDLAKDPQTSPYSINVIAANLDDARTRAAKLAAIPGVEQVVTAEQFLPKDQAPKLERLAQARAALGPAFMDANATEAAPDDNQLRQAFTRLSDAAETAVSRAPEGSELKAAAEAFRDGVNAFADKRGVNSPELRKLEEALVGSMPDIVDGLRSRLDATELAIADLPTEISKDWVTADGRLRLQVQPADDIGTPEGLEGFADKIQAVEPLASGVPISVTEAGTAILWSFAEAILYTTIAIALIVLALRRRLTDMLLILAPLAVAAVWTVAGSSLLNLPFNFANVIVIPLLIGLGVAGSVHIVIRARELAHENKGKPLKDQVDVLDTSTSMAVLVAQLNTVAAFATLAISHHRGLYSMGLLLGLSILLVVIVCLVVLPAAMIALHKPRGAVAAGPPLKAVTPRNTTRAPVKRRRKT